ncbi:MAG TPA: hypothetical protein ENH41_05760, partial [Candidatus Omnitrophica bacterium]|nr:hypothetical protein [Candidatus Omnitrophota bacterium]
MDSVTFVGICAGILTTSSFLPQVIKIHRTKKTSDLSLAMFVVLAIGISLWIIYGILLGSLPILLANSVVFVLCIYLIVAKIRYG